VSALTPLREDDMKKAIAAAAVLVTLSWAADGVAATSEEGTPGGVWESLRQATAEATIAAEHAIVIGGVVVYRNRHAIAGAVLGCAVGSAAAATPTLALALPTAGGSLAAAPTAAAVGCGIGGVGGAVLGHAIDQD
jgi:hypothetical protein